MQSDPRPHPWSYQRSIKDPEVEELIDLHWHRRLAYALIKPLEHRAPWLTPAHLTLVAMLLGMAAGWVAFWAHLGGPVWWIGSGLLLLGSVIFDCADGQLARLRGGGTYFGALLDGGSDFVVGVSIWLGLSYSSSRSLAHHWWTWPVLGLCLVSIVAHLGIYDHFKGLYERHTRPGATTASSALATPEARAARQYPSRLHAYIDWLYWTAYSSATSAFAKGEESQEIMAAPGEFRGAFARPMRWISFLGLGTQLALFYLAAILAVVEPTVPFWVAAVGINLVLNVWMVVAIWSWRRARAALQPEAVVRTSAKVLEKTVRA